MPFLPLSELSGGKPIEDWPVNYYNSSCIACARSAVRQYFFLYTERSPWYRILQRPLNSRNRSSRRVQRYKQDQNVNEFPNGNSEGKLTKRNKKLKVALNSENFGLPLPQGRKELERDRLKFSHETNRKYFISNCLKLRRTGGKNCCLEAYVSTNPFPNVSNALAIFLQMFPYRRSLFAIRRRTQHYLMQSWRQSTLLGLVFCGLHLVR